MEVIFEVPGQPRGKERPRWTMVSNTSIVYTPRNTRGYEDMIKTYYKINNFKTFKKDEALEVSAIAYYQIPKNTKKSHKLLMLKGEMLPTKKPDIDNIMKIVLDAVLYLEKSKQLWYPVAVLQNSNSLNNNALDQLYENMSWSLGNFGYF